MKAVSAVVWSAVLAGATLAAPAAGTVTVQDAWSRPAIETGVVYAVVRNDGAEPDRLIGGTTPVAAAVQLHQTVTSAAGASGSTMSAMPGMAGMPAGTTVMHEVSAVPVPAHGSARLAPGGYHIMLLHLKRALAAGQSFPLRLHFARAGWIAVSVAVRPN